MTAGAAAATVVIMALQADTHHRVLVSDVSLLRRIPETGAGFVPCGIGSVTGGDT